MTNKGIPGRFRKVFYTVNGKDYDNLDDLPEEIKEIFLNLSQNDFSDSSDTFESSETQYSFNGETYKSLDEMPENVKEAFVKSRNLHKKVFGDSPFNESINFEPDRVKVVEGSVIDTADIDTQNYSQTGGDYREYRPTKLERPYYDQSPTIQRPGGKGKWIMLGLLLGLVFMMVLRTVA